MSAHLEINEVTTGASLSTGKSPTTESTTPLNPGISAPTGSIRSHGELRTLDVTEAFVTIMLQALLHEFA